MSKNSSLISGTVHDSTGRVLSGARVSLAEGPVALPDIAMLTAADGSFSLAAPVPGTYRIICHADGFSCQSVTITVRSGNPAPLNFRLR